DPDRPAELRREPVRALPRAPAVDMFTDLVCSYWSRHFVLLRFLIKGACQPDLSQRAPMHPGRANGPGGSGRHSPARGLPGSGRLAPKDPECPDDDQLEDRPANERHDG